MATEVGSLVPKASNEIMAPPAPRAPKRKREETVLDEDEWVERIEAIIQRDYYPDLPKLESELEWLEAVRSKDPVLIRQAQANITRRRAGLKTPVGQTPASFNTPAFGATRTPNVLGTVQEDESGREGDAAPGSAAPEMSLDRFMAWHNSEDNASFGEILQGINKRRRLKYAWLHKTDRGASGNDAEVKLLEARPQDGFGTSGQPSGALLTWPQEPNNSLYYSRDAVPFSEKELAMQVQGPPKQIAASNTRLPSTSGEVDLAPTKKPERGDEYDRIATPSISPGRDAPPPMTWGRIAATPARIEDEGAGPRFKVPDRKPKDVLAHRLAEGARLNLQKRAALMSPSPLHSLRRSTPGRSKLVATPGVGGRTLMSPAASRLATNLRGKGPSGLDMALRASYRRSSLRRPDSALGTPAVPGPSETPAILHTPNAKQQQGRPTQASAEEKDSRSAALKAFDTDLARSQALKAFETTAARRDALKAFGRITDDLLEM